MKRLRSKETFGRIVATRPRKEENHEVAPALGHRRMVELPEQGFPVWVQCPELHRSVASFGPDTGAGHDHHLAVRRLEQATCALTQPKRLKSGERVEAGWKAPGEDPRLDLHKLRPTAAATGRSAPISASNCTG